jgi:hypothetical protein
MSRYTRVPQRSRRGLTVGCFYSDPELVSGRVGEVGLGAEIALGGPDIPVTQGELDLVQRRPAASGELGEGGPQVVGCQVPAKRAGVAGGHIGDGVVDIPAAVLDGYIMKRLAAPGSRSTTTQSSAYERGTTLFRSVTLHVLCRGSLARYRRRRVFVSVDSDAN